MSDEYREQLRRTFLDTPFSQPGPPWGKRRCHLVGGATGVGFAPDSDLLLVASVDGRGVFDCATGERVARERGPGQDWFDTEHLLAEGIGPLSGQRILMSGLFGGGLGRITTDGWSTDTIPIDFYEFGFYLTPPRQQWFDRTREDFGVIRIEPDITEFRAFGFSQTGRTLLLASSGVIYFWHRPSVP
jgi:hypothetical protein